METYLVGAQASIHVYQDYSFSFMTIREAAVHPQLYKRDSKFHLILDPAGRQELTRIDFAGEPKQGTGQRDQLAPIHLEGDVSVPVVDAGWVRVDELGPGVVIESSWGNLAVAQIAQQEVEAYRTNVRAVSRVRVRVAG